MQRSAQIGISILSASSKNQANNTVIFFQVTKLLIHNQGVNTKKVSQCQERTKA